MNKGKFLRIDAIISTRGCTLLVGDHVPVKIAAPA